MNTNDATMLSRWYAEMATDGLSKNTIRRRRLTLDRFAEAYDLATATQHDVRAWLASLSVSPTSRGLYLGDIRAFYRWALLLDYLEADPTAKIKPMKRKDYVPKPIPTTPLRIAIMDAPPRIRTMLTLAGYAGMRCAEIADMRGEDVDHEAGNIRIRGKGDKVRIVALHPLIAELVPPGTKGPIVSWHGKAITPDSVSTALRTYLRGSAQLNATGHMARHSFGTRLYNETKDLAAVQEAMGHASPITTRGYVKHDAAVARRGILALE